MCGVDRIPVVFTNCPNCGSLMRDVLIRYGLVANIAWVAVFMAWVYGGTRVELLTAVPWLCLAVLEMTWLLPAPRKSETMERARRRVGSSLRRDPLLYLGLIFTLYLLMQYVNGGRPLTLDAVQERWTFALSPLGWGPSCVDRADAGQALFWFPAAFAVVLGVRHGVTRRGKLFLLRVLVANGALLSLVGVVLFVAGAERVLGLMPTTAPFFASFPYANQAGAFFILHSALALGLLVHAWLEAEEGAR